jgi:hypothetical protein
VSPGTEVSDTALRDFFACFDELSAAATDLAALPEVLAAAGAAAAGEPFADSAVHGNLRAPQISVLGGSGAEPLRERTVAGRRLSGYADPRALTEELRHGAAVLVDRADLWSPALGRGLASVGSALDSGRLACYQLYLQPRAQTLRFDCAQVSHLVTQLAGETAWDDEEAEDAAEDPVVLTAGGTRHLPPRGAGGTVSCRPISPTVLLVLAHRRPDRRHLHGVLAEWLLARFQETGAAERHHLVAASKKADWLRDQLVAELTGPDSRTWFADLDLVPEARLSPPTVLRAAPGRGAATAGVPGERTV